MSKEKTLRRLDGDFLKKAAFVGFTVLTLNSGCLNNSPLNKPNENLGKPTAGPNISLEIKSFYDDRKLIEEEVKRLGEIPDEAEQQMWQNAYQRSLKPAPLTKETLNQAKSYLSQTLENMEKSHNRYFRHVPETMKEMIQKGKLEIIVDPTMDGKTFVEIGTAKINNDNLLELAFNGLQIVNESNGLYLAIILAREGKHLENALKTQGPLLPRLTTEQKLRQQEKNQMEALAVQSKALLESWQLGVKGELPGDLVRILAEYIRTGKDENSELWKTFVKNYLKSEKEKLQTPLPQKSPEVVF